jgi:hypothetical protein
MPNQGRVLAVNFTENNYVSVWLGYEFVELLGGLNFRKVTNS